MPRPLTAAALTAALALCAAGPAAAPAAASSGPSVLYGFAWADGTGALRITPAKATPVKRHGVLRYTLKPLPGAGERRIDYSGAEFRRITAECDLKETEGVVKLDKKGLGRTRCQAADLTAALGHGPVPVRISILGEEKRIHEFLANPTASKKAYGTVKRVNGTTVVFTKGKTSVKLGYTLLDFRRVTGKCGDSWLADHVNAARNGLGTKACGTSSFTRALKGAEYPVLARVEYDPVRGQLLQVWEVFGDA
ncbi:hypothetical protein [Planomonospora venezuelensis]|uniref:META domain-containing protein n=1 Tax=Planomonospora venezuelensis TaxID=1999 RepID=A0A841D2B3_PLAVE|nr:hypothetical protein [Planomonospora venezuelensis]MBB5963629.1 hypothetical protein [Planomonospora venezuelensis]GIN01417.1 hypothetical protein Pve01_30750 [Planomonospora venezuelensis]